MRLLCCASTPSGTYVDACAKVRAGVWVTIYWKVVDKNERLRRMAES